MKTYELDWSSRLFVAQAVLGIWLKPFPRYVCHKQVGALQIKAVIPNPRGFEFHFTDETFVPIQVSSEWLMKHLPREVLNYEHFVGGYAVWYDDGHMSFSPAKAFEEGYIRIEDPRIMPSQVCDVSNPPT